MERWLGVVDVCEWLNNYKKADELINGKRAEKAHLLDERQRLIDKATDISSKMPDGMPYSDTGIVSQKLQNAVVSKVIVDRELESVDNAISEYLAFKKEVITALEKLPAVLYGVLHRYYIRGMTIEAIADDLGYSTRQIKRIKKKALKMLEDVLECHHIAAV